MPEPVQSAGGHPAHGPDCGPHLSGQVLLIYLDITGKEMILYVDNNVHCINEHVLV